MKTLKFALLFFVVGIFSCEKTDQPSADNSSRISGINMPSIREGSASQPPVALRDNHDGTWTGSVAGLAVRFYDFNYELRDDPMGGTLPPVTGDPAWPASIGPEPGVTSNYQFACLKIVNDAVYPDNQWVITNQCIFGGMIYVPGSNTNQYHSTVQQIWTQGVIDYNNWYASFRQCMSTPGCLPITRAPGIPSLPDPIPYLTKDFVTPPSSNIMYLCRFVVNVNVDGEVSFGIITK